MARSRQLKVPAAGLRRGAVSGDNLTALSLDDIIALSGRDPGPARKDVIRYNEDSTADIVLECDDAEWLAEAEASLKGKSIAQMRAASALKDRPFVVDNREEPDVAGGGAKP